VTSPSDAVTSPSDAVTSPSDAAIELVKFSTLKNI
jgi:hypothetical protein